MIAIVPDTVILVVAVVILIAVIVIPVLALIGLYLMWKKYGRRWSCR
jgi:hypothetical protein